MKLDKKKFIKEILKKRFENNQEQCAHELGLTPAYISKIVKKDAGIGIKFISALKIYCINNGLEFDEFIILI